jgi:sugar lactone lactonase YvrE
VSNPDTRTLLDGLAFPEAPRWREDRLWFTDQHARTVQAVSPAGDVQTLAVTEDLPGGLGWLPNGDLLVVFMTRRCVMRWTGSTFALYANLADLARFHCNDMLADSSGALYVGNFGFDLHRGAAPVATELVRVDPDGTRSVFAGDLVFPNGCALTADGRTLLVAETFAHRITAFALRADGLPSTRTLWAALGERTPDGICLDHEGALWIASPGTSELVRVAPGGDVLERCRTRGTPYACMLGGEDRRTLYVCTSETDDPAEAARVRSGRIETIEVQVPGAGLP